MIDEYGLLTWKQRVCIRNNIVVLVHQGVRQLRNLAINPELLRRSIVFCWQEVVAPPRLDGLGRGNSNPRPVEHPAKEALMELRTRLNVLAAIISFAFLTAVVFGMF